MSLESFVLIDSMSKMDSENPSESEDTDTIDTQASPEPPPSASSFLQQHTHHDDLDKRTVSSGTMVSNLIEGLVGGGSGSADNDDASVNSMKHRKERSSYDQRTPKMTGSSGISSAIPYRGFDSGSKKVAPQEDGASRRPPSRPPAGPFAGFLRKLLSPRATDIEQLLIKLQNQFQKLEIDHRRYILTRDGSRWDDPNPAKRHSKEDLNDPKHPMNNPNLISEVHFVGRKAIDSSIIDLSYLLMKHDYYGSIKELWLNDNLISDEGAEALASFLQQPTCALTELWLGNNEIGPAGTTLISAALSNNSGTNLKCLGLYLNPIGNGGAMALCQMLRKNNTLTTLDVHGCGRNRGGSSNGRGQEVLEGYGCKVIKASDGTEYIARVVAPTSEEDEGLVTDQRLLDAIQTFVAFNRIDPTREQAVRGIMTSNKISQDDTKKEQQVTSDVAKFLAELSSLPAHEKLTDDEKRTWKDCEWERLYVELERARAARRALAERLEVSNDEANTDTLGNKDGNVNDEKERLTENDGMKKDEENEMIGKSLDDEVVQTDSRTWRDLKMGITGTIKPVPRDRTAPQGDTGNKEEGNSKESGERVLGAPPKSVFPIGGMTDEDKDTLALETVVTVEEE